MDKCGILEPDDSYSQGQHDKCLKTERRKEKVSDVSVREIDSTEWDQSFSLGVLLNLFLNVTSVEFQQFSERLHNVFVQK